MEEFSAVFPAIDRGRADRGRELYTNRCAGCHEKWTTTPTGTREYQLFALEHVKTDPATAVAFEQPVTIGSVQQPFPLAAFEIVRNVKAAYYKRNRITPEQIANFENTSKRTPPQIVRLPLQQGDQFPDTKGGKVYRATTYTKELFPTGMPSAAAGGR